MIWLVMATTLEAEPFIKKLALIETEKRPFHVYSNKDIRLIISGIGKTNSAMASTYLIQYCRPLCVCNIGASGSTGLQHSLGEIYHIGKIIEPDRINLKTGIPHEHIPDTLPGFPTAVLATQDSPLHTPDERGVTALYAELADMEGASVAQVCRRFHVKCFLFKFVSDTPEHTCSKDIISNIKSYSDSCADFFQCSILPELRTVASGLAEGVCQP